MRMESAGQATGFGRIAGAFACVGRVAALVLLGAGLAGCARGPTVTAAPGPPVNLSGYSPAFKEGFAGGCDTARGTARRDESRYRDDPQYARGWDDGRSICARK